MFRRYPEMMIETVADDVLKAINRYLSATDSEIREDFVLYDFMRFRAVRDGNRADVENNAYFQQLLKEADRWESAMEQPALIDNDHVPLPVDWTDEDAKRTSVKFPSKSTKAVETPAASKPESATTPESQPAISSNSEAEVTSVDDSAAEAAAPAAGNRPPQLKQPE